MWNHWFSIDWLSTPFGPKLGKTLLDRMIFNLTSLDFLAVIVTRFPCFCFTAETGFPGLICSGLNNVKPRPATPPPPKSNTTIDGYAKHGFSNEVLVMLVEDPLPSLHPCNLVFLYTHDFNFLQVFVIYFVKE